ncbi:YoaK family protein [Cetobacterium sp.]|uniref:YoaK family protein n=1 Tax=Cetobacterium sp. TaxID=2071632 RepID=UPI0025E5A67B|nr:YoaK family protein [uncultured Cetobacterium sp.]
MEQINKKLFLWISLLALLGGGMNAFAILQFSLTVSHITGSVTRISTDLAYSNIPHLKIMLGLVVSFFSGAIVSGIMIGSGRDFELKKRYGDTFIFIGILLKIIDIYLYDKIIFAFVLAFSLGLQNGLFIRYKGMVIRTTHMSGTVTDLGVVIGHYLRGNREIMWKMKYYAINILSFITGGLLVGLGLKYLGRNVLNYMSLAYVLSGIYYFLLRDRYYKTKR